MGIRSALTGLCLAVSLVSLSPLTSAKSYDVLELPAVPSKLAAHSLIYTIAEYHGRYFATGHHGHILYSDDAENWTQAEVPVRSSILDIHFPTPELGWAVGHEGVILHSGDGGKTWAKQYDGLRYGQEGLAYYEKLSEENPDNELFAYLVEEMQFAIEQGADKPLFRVYFHNEKFGHALGAYGMLLRTEDGGEHWKHVLHNTENDSFYHVFDVARLPGKGRFFMSGEAGLFMVGDAYGEKATLAENVPWQGSFFTAEATADDAILLGGLRGRMFLTPDEGETWEEVQKPPTSSIVDSAVLPDGRIVVVGIGGEVLISTDQGRSFDLVPIRTGSRNFTVEHGPGNTLLIGGPAGIQTFPLPQ